MVKGEKRVVAVAAAMGETVAAVAAMAVATEMTVSWARSTHQCPCQQAAAADSEQREWLVLSVLAPSGRSLRATSYASTRRVRGACTEKR